MSAMRKSGEWWPEAVCESKKVPVDLYKMAGNKHSPPFKRTRFTSPEEGGFGEFSPARQCNFLDVKFFVFLSSFYFQIRIKVVSYKCSV